MKSISIVIPVRTGDTPEPTLRSLARQTCQDFEVILSWQGEKEEVGANRARNRGAELATAPLILFSDADINWQPNAIMQMKSALEENPGASFAYGAYEMAGVVQCAQPFDARRLRRGNYISSMTMLRRDHWAEVGWDETIGRLQDWDLFLGLTSRGRTGIYVGGVTFTTVQRDGITQNGPVSFEEARRRVAEKHNL